MLWFCFVETKDQWARDDPAFLVLLSFSLCGKFVLDQVSGASLLVTIWKVTGLTEKGVIYSFTSIYSAPIVVLSHLVSTMAESM